MRQKSISVMKSPQSCPSGPRMSSHEDANSKITQWVAATMLGVEFDNMGECVGIGLRDGSRANGEDQAAHM